MLSHQDTSLACLAAGTEQPPAWATELKTGEMYFSVGCSGLQAANAAICSLLRMRVSCTEVQQVLEKTAPKENKGFSEASSEDATALLEELGMIQVIGDTTELSTPDGKPDPPQSAVRL